MPVLQGRLSPLLALRKPAAMLWAAYREDHLARNWGQPLADIQQETEAFSPAACKEWKAANNHMSLDTDATAAPTSILIEALLAPEVEHLAKPCPDSWPSERGNKCVFY